MYRLMKSDKLTLNHVVSGQMSSYRQTEVGQFQKFDPAIQACEVANNKGRWRYYVVNELSQEYYDGTWID